MLYNLWQNNIYVQQPKYLVVKILSKLCSVNVYIIYVTHTIISGIL